MNQGTIRIKGGIDLVTSPIGMDPGHLIGCENYEPKLGGGVERVGGIEVYDGQTSPHDGEYVVLGASSWGAGATVGATLTGATSGATGTIAYVSGALLAVSKVTGTFQAGENCTVSAVVVGSSISYEPTITAAQQNTIAAASAAIYAADIGEVPGAGDVCGVCIVNNTVYAFRNNVGNTKQVCWKASAAGWVELEYPAPYIVSFTAGSGTWDGGAVTLTRGGNTAIIHRIYVRSGTLAGGDAAGTVLLRAASTPGAFTSGAATSSEFNATLGSDYEAVELLPNGRWKFSNYMFSSEVNITPSSSAYPWAYGCDATQDDGGGNLIEFDGRIISPIRTSDFYETHVATCVATHKDHLFVAIRGSVWYSGLSEPGTWTVLSGAGEIVIGEPVREMLSIQGDQNDAALLVCTNNTTQIIYGTSGQWNMVPLSRQVGAKEHSMQQLGNATIAMDEAGVRNFMPSQNFGNFSTNTLTDHIRKKVTGKTPTASVLDRTNGRYRLFFSDGTWLSGLPSGRRWEWTICAYPFTVTNAYEGEIDGVSTVFVMGDDGYVYQADKGRNFGGQAITAWLKMAFAHMGSPTMRKAFKLAEIEVRSDTVGSISVQPDYSYGDTAVDESAMAAYENAPLLGSDGAWDLGLWDIGTWDGAYLGLLRIRAPGVGENVSLLLHSSSSAELKHELTAITHYYQGRRSKR